MADKSNKQGKTKANNKTLKKPTSNKKNNGKMSPKVTNSKKKNKTAKKSKNDKAYGIKLIILFAFTLFSILSVHTSFVGPAGSMLSHIYFGLFGKLGYIVPYFIFLLVLFSINPNFKKTKMKYLGGSISIFSALLLIISLENIDTIIEMLTFNKTSALSFQGLNIAYEAGVSKAGGGLIGFLLEYLFMQILGKGGVYVVILAMILLAISLATNISIKSIFAKKKAIKETLSNVKIPTPVRWDETSSKRSRRRINDKKVVKDTKPVMATVTPIASVTTSNSQKMKDMRKRVDRIKKSTHNGVKHYSAIKGLANQDNDNYKIRESMKSKVKTFRVYDSDKEFPEQGTIVAQKFNRHSEIDAKTLVNGKIPNSDNDVKPEEVKEGSPEIIQTSTLSSEVIHEEKQMVEKEAAPVATQETFKEILSETPNETLNEASTNNETIQEHKQDEPEDRITRQNNTSAENVDAINKDMPGDRGVLNFKSKESKMDENFSLRNRPKMHGEFAEDSEDMDSSEPAFKVPSISELHGKDEKIEAEVEHEIKTIPSISGLKNHEMTVKVPSISQLHTKEELAQSDLEKNQYSAEKSDINIQKNKNVVENIDKSAVNNKSTQQHVKRPSKVVENKKPKKKAYKKPSIDLLNTTNNSVDEKQSDVLRKAEKLETTLKTFGVEATVIQINRGPTITMFELELKPGIKVSKITGLTDDIALALAARRVRVIAPIPGKSAVGVEIPNKNKSLVGLKDVINTDDFKNAKSVLTCGLGKDITGTPVMMNLAKMPHLLIAGATGSGKSVCVNTLISSILFRATPDEVKFLMIDPKVVELNVYNGIPHLILPVVTDPKKAAIALNWAVSEMTRRYQLFAESGTRDVDSYNKKMRLKNKEDDPELSELLNLTSNMSKKNKVDVTKPNINPALTELDVNIDEDIEILPKIVVIIDELADLMMVAPDQVEDAICRLAQMARAAGIHLIVATQRPSVDVITGIIKANIPSRIAFSVSSQTDSRTILDRTGAEKLLGMGDMLYYPTGFSEPQRIQGAFISDDEVSKLTDMISAQVDDVEYDDDILENDSFSLDKDEEADEYLEDAIALVVNNGQGSASMLQRKFRIGYNRAARLIDEMEERGIVGPNKGSKPRDVLINLEDLEELNDE